jgi:hypothetical protein
VKQAARPRHVVLAWGTVSPDACEEHNRPLDRAFLPALRVRGRVTAQSLFDAVRPKFDQAEPPAPIDRQRVEEWLDCAWRRGLVDREDVDGETWHTLTPDGIARWQETALSRHMLLARRASPAVRLAGSAGVIIAGGIVAWATAKAALGIFFTVLGLLLLAAGGVGFALYSLADRDIAPIEARRAELRAAEGQDAE